MSKRRKTPRASRPAAHPPAIAGPGPDGGRLVLSRPRTPRPAVDRPSLRAAVEAHVERHLGPVAWSWLERRGDWVRVRVLGVAPAPERPFWTLVTAGMAGRPMPLPPEAGGGRAWGELVLLLPADWPMEALPGDDPRRSWPLRALTDLARYPHRHRTWIDRGHSLADGPDPGPLFPGTEQCCWLLAFPSDLPVAFSHLDHGGMHIHFSVLWGLYAAEMHWKLAWGHEDLLRLFAGAGIGPVVRPRRPCVIPDRGPPAGQGSKRAPRSG